MGTGTESIWQLLVVASPFAKFILMILGVMSLLSWTVILDKFLMWVRVRKDSKGFEGVSWKNFDPRNMFGEARRYHSAFPARAYIYAHRELFERGIPDDLDGEMVAREYARAAAHHLNRAERFLPFLATCSAAAPFLGLLGTVWGIISAFQRIGIWGNASIAVVAPGIAEALVATALGLFVAIPALIAYNFFSNWLRKEAERAEAFGDDLAFAVDRQFVRRNAVTGRVGVA
ncbi:MAG: MotA/TolQ/ExbB proton channel family protein [Calditrichaeota bacterium]|nr:MotA/TolQ/ExbB proton channel family protein [Calditrichota bacterium]MCB9391408.1 MotA/TolQ/ExbB proton channel family protein [Calditrichota bacterium]